MATPPELPLQDVRVLDLSRLLPGPYASLVLADLGAQVDRVESPDGGDPVRQMPPLKGDEGALHLGLNRSKRSLVLDLKSPTGVEALLRLVKGYDVLLESFRPGVMERLGLSPERLLASNPRLIVCSISGFGQTGPDRLRAGHDLGYVARSGLLGQSGGPDGAPGIIGGQIADIGGGALFGLVAILAALHERARTGQGKHLDISMTDGAVAFQHLQLAGRMVMGEEAGPLRRGQEALNGGYGCYGVYRTADDRYLAVGALEPKFASGMLAVLGLPDLLPALYAGGAEGARARHTLAATFLTRSRDAWMEAFEGKDLCIEPVAEGDEILSDPQLRARGLFFELEDPERGTLPQLRTPLIDWPIAPRPPPRLGEHGREILTEAGFTEEELSALGVR
jgi:alpha-methylacyl-CoA racemase